MLLRGRLAALLPHVSTVVNRAPPLRFEQGMLQLNAVVAYEHIAIQTEASLRCHRLPGLKGLQEEFPNMMTPPSGLSAIENDPHSMPSSSATHISPSLSRATRLSRARRTDSLARDGKSGGEGPATSPPVPRATPARARLQTSRHRPLTLERVSRPQVHG